MSRVTITIDQNTLGHVETIVSAENSDDILAHRRDLAAPTTPAPIAPEVKAEPKPAPAPRRKKGARKPARRR